MKVKQDKSRQSGIEDSSLPNDRKQKRTSYDHIISDKGITVTKRDYGKRKIYYNLEILE